MAQKNFELILTMLLLFTLAFSAMSLPVVAQDGSGETDTVVIPLEPTPVPTLDVQPPQIVPAVEITTKEGQSGLAVCTKSADGKPIKEKYVEVYYQVEDVSGDPTYGNQLFYGRTSQTGCVSFQPEPGVYVVQMPEFRGYYWGNMDSVPGMSGLEVRSNQITILTITWGALLAGFVNAEGKPIEDQYVEVYSQTSDLDGNPVTDDQVAYGSTDNRGMIEFYLMPGLYIVASEFRGYNWGNATDVQGEANIPVSAGQVTRIQRRLGALIAEVRNSDGNAAENAYIQFYTQTDDVSGNPATGREIGSGSTDNTGRIGIRLTQGTYAIKIGDYFQYDIPVEWGKITYVDGKQVLRME